MTEPATRWTLPWKCMHFFIIGLLLFQSIYAVVLVFIVLAPDGQMGWLGARAAGFPLEEMMPRRLYALEGWLAFCTLVIYLAVVEIRPRRHS